MSREKIWIAGADGRLGHAIYEILDRINEYTVLTTDRDVDVTDLEQVMDFAANPCVSAGRSGISPFRIMAPSAAVFARKLRKERRISS